MDNIVTSHIVPEADRVAFVDKLFGINYVLKLEPAVFTFAEELSANYDYGYWEFLALSNGGFYMAPHSDTIFNVISQNGFECEMTADALGIVSCLDAFSHLSFGQDAFAQTCANHYHLLRDYMFVHPEIRRILAAID